jgi:hypothetical protein
LIPQRVSVYADDVIIFLKAKTEDCIATKFLLEAFGSATGLQCNMAKGSILSIYGGLPIFEEISNLLNCQISNMPITYLGLPLRLGKARKEDFQILSDKIKNY